MKEKTFLQLLMLAILSLGLTSCDNSDNTSYEGGNRVIAQLAASDDVQAFFDTELTLYQQVSPRSVFFDWGEFFNPAMSFCYQVNSQEDLQELYHGDLPLPGIDFSGSTLLMGAYPANVTALKSQWLEETAEGYTLHITATRDLSASGFTWLVSFNYWGLYPKLSPKPVAVELTVEEYASQLVPQP